MAGKKRWALYGVGLSMLLGGCADSDNTPQVKDQYERVQDYKGEGYSLNNGEENDKIAEAHRKEIEQAVKTFFLESYKTEVKVHNLVGNVDGVTVFVESTGPVHFYTYAIVSLNEDTIVDGVRTQEGEVERGIREGLYRLVLEKEFHHLDAYLEKVASEHKVVGRTIESLQNVGGSGHMTPYYSLSSLKDDEAIKPVYDLYMENPKMKVERLKEAYEAQAFEADMLRINIMLFMEEENVPPSEKTMEKVANDLQDLRSIPRGTYRVAVNDNGVHKESFEGFKDNSMEEEVIMRD